MLLKYYGVGGKVRCLFDQLLLIVQKMQGLLFFAKKMVVVITKRVRVIPESIAIAFVHPLF